MLKQYVFVPMDLMSKGKMASQVAHATFLALDKFKDKKLILEWKSKGMCVIVLECEDQNHLIHIAEYLKQWKITHALYVDEGITETLPLTATALATGIIKEEDTWMFEKFQLYNDENGTKSFLDRLLRRN